MTDVLTVGALGSVLLARWKMLVAFVVVGLGLGLTYGVLAPDSYSSKAVLFVLASPANQDGFYPAAQFAEKRAATYPALLSAPEVLERTRTALDLDAPASSLIGMLTATNPTDSSLVEVSATAATPKLAQQLANTAADYLAEYAVDLEEGGTKVGAVTIEKAVPARVPHTSSSPSPKVLGVLGGLAGAALGVMVALCVHAWQRRRNGRSSAASASSAESGEPGEADATGPARPLQPAQGYFVATGRDGEPYETAPTNGYFVASDGRQFPVASPAAASSPREPRPRKRPTGRARTTPVAAPGTAGRTAVPAAAEAVHGAGTPNGSHSSSPNGASSNGASTNGASTVVGTDVTDLTPWRSAQPTAPVDYLGHGASASTAGPRSAELRQGYATPGRVRTAARRK